MFSLEPGTCCDCRYSGPEETPCPMREDHVHCVHWRDRPEVVHEQMEIPLTLMCKLGSIVIHAQELCSPKGHIFDKAALQALLEDYEVNQWLAELETQALIPKKR